MIPTAMPAPTSASLTELRLLSIASAYLVHASPRAWQICCVPASTVLGSPGEYTWDQKPLMACVVSSLISRVPSADCESPATEPTELAALCHAVAAARTLSVWALGQNFYSGPGRNHTVSPGPIAEAGLASGYRRTPAPG